MDKFRKLILAAALAAVLPAWAEVSRDDAAAIAQRATHGRVLAVERAIHTDNRLVWRVKVLTNDGQVRVVLVEVATGRAF
jgi:uncharacterized membrane protein YkoI